MSYTLNYSFTSCKTYTVTLDPGVYRLEVWGAKGGTGTAAGGKGGYSRGELTLNEVANFHIHVGSQGGDYNSPGCNGGGKGGSSNYRSGGGATDIRINKDSLLARIIVAGGGGGGADYSGEPGGFGGGLNGGDGQNDNYAGKGAGQETETTKCKGSTSYTCGKGTFGYGGNSSDSSNSNAAGAGGGWYGGSAGANGDAGGGGSGYILTEDSFKPSGYLLNDKKYFLKNAVTLGGDKSFPSPTSSSEEVGHDSDGYARITCLLPKRTVAKTPFETALATLKASMIGIRPSLRFTFRSTRGSIMHDKLGMFRFSQFANYTAYVNPGRFLFYANGSQCGQSIFAFHKIVRISTMNVSIASAVDVSIDEQHFIHAAGFPNTQASYVDPKATTFFNFTMNNYDCKQRRNSSLIIGYHPFRDCTFRMKENRTYFQYFLIMLIAR